MEKCEECGKPAFGYIEAQLGPLGITGKWWFCKEHLLDNYVTAQAKGVTCAEIVMEKKGRWMR